MKMFKFFIIIFAPFVDVILTGAGFSYPINLLRITPLILAVAALYNFRRTFIPITLAVLFFVLLNYPYDIQALFFAVAVPAFFVLRRLFFFLSEQWLTFVVLLLGFTSGYILWLISNISWGLIDYEYFFYGFVFQVLINVFAAFLLFRSMDRFETAHLYEISTRI